MTRVTITVEDGPRTIEIVEDDQLRRLSGESFPRVEALLGTAVDRVRAAVAVSKR